MDISYRQSDFQDYLTDDKRSQKKLGIQISTFSNMDVWAYQHTDKPFVADPNEPIHKIVTFNSEHDSNDKVSLNLLRGKIIEKFVDAGWERRGDYYEKQQDFDEPKNTIRRLGTLFGPGVEVTGDNVNAMLIIPFYDFMKKEFGVDL